jgi:ABC-type glycerol-3-phosphate transport system substrate-binding protein
MPDLVITNNAIREEVLAFLEPLMKQWGLADQWRLQHTTWAQLRPLLKEAAIRKVGAEVAQVGTTWVSGFVAMNTLRPFAPLEVARIRQTGNFIPLAWETTSLGNNQPVWSIPWSADARIMFYWDDMFERAKVDPRSAFQNPQAFEAALEQLQSSGTPTPWVVATTPIPNTVQYTGMWIWQHGGEFLTRDGRQVLFTEPAAMAGIEAYFRLHRFTALKDELLEERDVLEQFLDRRAACILAGSWLLLSASLRHFDSDTLSHLKASLPPAPPFVGGSNLVIMQHISPRYEQSALELILRLISEPFGQDYFYVTGYLPVQSNVLTSPPFTEDPHLHVFAEALRIGRSIPNTIRWGIVEDELVKVFATIWTTIKAKPDEPLRPLLERQLEPLAKRLNRTLSI